MGAEVAEFEDGLTCRRPDPARATIDSGSDHRIAMAFSVAALRAEGDTLIQGAESAAISFPEFFDCWISSRNVKFYSQTAEERPSGSRELDGLCSVNRKDQIENFRLL